MSGLSSRARSACYRLGLLEDDPVHPGAVELLGALAEVLEQRLADAAAAHRLVDKEVFQAGMDERGTSQHGGDGRCVRNIRTD